MMVSERVSQISKLNSKTLTKFEIENIPNLKSEHNEYYTGSIFRSSKNNYIVCASYCEICVFVYDRCLVRTERYLRGETSDEERDF